MQEDFFFFFASVAVSGKAYVFVWGMTISPKWSTERFMIGFHDDKSDCSAVGRQQKCVFNEHEQKHFLPQATDNADMTVKVHNHVARHRWQKAALRSGRDDLCGWRSRLLMHLFSSRRWGFCGCNLPLKGSKWELNNKGQLLWSQTIDSYNQKHYRPHSSRRLWYRATQV